MRYAIFHAAWETVLATASLLLFLRPYFGDDPRPNQVAAPQQSQPPELKLDEAPALERAFNASEEFLKVLG